MNDPRCTACAHHPHPDRPCQVQRVHGPATTTSHPIYDRTQPPECNPIGYDHGGRTVTPCDCKVYQPPNNGHTHP